MTSYQKLSKSQNLTRLLDDNRSPVPRMRLFSEGVRTNNRMVNNEPVTGDKGCLACGNCVDACPVIREKKRFVFLLNRRTSMFLENTVDDECRRCYACVRACPQVGKTTKEFVVGFRRSEKIVHVALATLIFTLASTGIFLYHYKEVIPDWQQTLFQLSHLSAGILLMLVPFLYFFIDKAHLKRAIKNSFHFDKSDLDWLKGFWRYLVKPGRNPLPNWREFNTYHKFWFFYLAVMIPVLGVTGLVSLGFGEKASFFFGLHAFFALTVDLLVITHLYFKLIRRIFRDISDIKTSFQQKGNFDFPFLYDPKSDSAKRN